MMKANGMYRAAGQRTVIALVLLAAFGQASSAADGDDLGQWIKPESSVTLGVGGATGNSRDRAFFGQYSGMRTDSAYGVFDIDYVNRNDATGTWLTLTGRNLGLDNRELTITHEKQGDWKYSLSYDELVRRDPRTINTAMSGAGTATPTINRLVVPGTGSDVNLKTKREKLGLEFEKWFGQSLQFEASFKNEEKTGARLFGIGYDCASYVCATTQNATNTRWALLLVPEPINSTTRQFEAKLNYSGDKFVLTGGYYGSFYSNDHGNVQATVPGQLYNAIGTLTTLSGAAAGGTSLQNVLQSPIALPPNNQAHQFYVSGNYAFTSTTKANFKYAYTHATQHDDFAGSGLTGAPLGRSNLGGEINTTLAQFGLTSRPLPKLTLVANVRYEDKQDKTPIDRYNIENTTTWYNSHMNSTKLAGKFEASYQVFDATRATLGVDYLSNKRSLPSATDVSVAGLSGLRGKTEEVGYRAELRRSLADNFSGAIAYIGSKRTGSNWYNLCTTAACTPIGYGSVVPASTIVAASPTAIFPMTLKDRTREKWRMSGDWSPIDPLSLQFSLENGVDHYTTPGLKGVDHTGMVLYSIDAAWTVSDKWKLTGYWSYGEQRLEVQQGNGGYDATPKNFTSTFGLGVKGQPNGRLTVGADLIYLSDITKYNVNAASGANANNTAQAAIGLPDLKYTQLTLKAFGSYALDKQSDLRFDLVHQRVKYKDWAWDYNDVAFVYSDGTTVSTKSTQEVTFVGVSYVYHWR